MRAFRPLRQWFSRLLFPGKGIRQKYKHFKALLRADALALDIIADLDSHLYGYDPADMHKIKAELDKLMDAVGTMVSELMHMNAEYKNLDPVFHTICAALHTQLQTEPVDQNPPYVIALDKAADHPFLVGGKATNLSRVARYSIPTPPGFVVTATAFFRFLHDNKLEKKIATAFQNIALSNFDEIIQVTGEMQERILASDIPDEIIISIETALQDFPPDTTFAVRSSALSEDGIISFAGQYASELHVPRKEILAAYKRVLAGKYCPRAVAYRIRHGLTDFDTAMAVLILPMIPALVAGVVYTSDPAFSLDGEKAMGIYVVPSVADSLVDGSATPEKYYLTRDQQPQILSALKNDGAGYVAHRVLESLGALCMRLEHKFGTEQDVEWAYVQDQLFILQTRPLQKEKPIEEIASEEINNAEVLFSGLECASPGAACGPVFHVDRGLEFRNIPQGSVVVINSLKPALSQFLDSIAAIIATHGSRASHLASVAREWGIPVLVGEGGATLNPEEIVTIDAINGAIYLGCLPSLLAQNQSAQKDQALIRAENKDLAKLSVVLHLIDPQAPEFSPLGCQSLHDVVRFCHEKSILEMFSLVNREGRGMTGARKIITDLPLVMYLIDLGGGLSPQAQGAKNIEVGWLRDGPLKSLWAGLSDKRIHWDDSQTHIDWEVFDRISGGIFKLDSSILASYAVIAEDYLHLNVRFGYHFSIIDSICSTISGANYIKFKFKGGGGALEQRTLRLQFIKEILEQAGFEVTIKGDILDATLQRLSAPKIHDRLITLGLILAYTRLLDIKLTDTQDVTWEVEKFIHMFL